MKQSKIKRRVFLAGLAVSAGALMVMGTDVVVAHDAKVEKINLTDAEWKEKLSPEAYRVLRKDGTEPAGSSPLNDEKREGVFACAACGLELFKSKMKYDSGTGWPSFYDVIDGHVETKKDFKLILPRTEYHCARCGGHQGHVFDDGPAPTGSVSYTHLTLPTKA